MSFVDAHDFPVGLVLRVLDIASSTYYEWRARRAAPAYSGHRTRAAADGLVPRLRDRHAQH
jgi:putative transposase